MKVHCTFVLQNFALKLGQGVSVSPEVVVNLPVGLICISAYLIR